jgi:hypothetical protein
MVFMARVVPDGGSGLSEAVRLRDAVRLLAAVRLLDAVRLRDAVQDHCRAHALLNVSYITYRSAVPRQSCAGE